MKKNQNGFIQIPILIAVIIGLLVLGSVGYFGVKQYKNDQANQLNREEVIEEIQGEGEQTSAPLEVQQEAEQGQENKNEQTPPASTSIVPNSTSASNPASSYEDLHCPKIIKLEDSLGNMGDVLDGWLRGTIKKGEVNTIVVKITTNDPQNKTLYYRFLDTSGSDDGAVTATPPGQWSSWSTDNTITLNLRDDIKPGVNKIWVRYEVDNRDGFNCSSDTDLQNAITYTVIP